MRSFFQYPITSRVRDIFYMSPPAPGNIQVFENVPEHVVAVCPSGTGTATADVPAGWFSSIVSQDDANNKAIQYGLLVAQAKLVCNFIMECAVRAGSGNLIGLPEYADPSTPPRYYRRQTYSGQVVDCEYSVPFCGGETFGHSLTQASGAYQIDGVTGTVTNDQLIGRGADGHATACSNVITPTAFNFPFDPSVGYPPIPPPDDGLNQDDYRTKTVTKTEYLLDYNKGCIASTVEFDWRRQWSGAISGTLSDEDTENDAINRVFGGADAGYSDYQSTVGGVCCLARLDLRPPGVSSFNFRQVKYRLTLPGLIPGSIHDITVDMMRRIEGSTDDFVSVAIDEFDGMTVDDAGNIVVEGFVLNDPGYETYPSFSGSNSGACDSIPIGE